MMASSQVEFAASSPFGCALRGDHNRRNRCTTAAPFNDLVSPCISNEHSHSRHHVDFTDLWVHQPQWQSSTSSVNSSPDNNVTVRKNGNDNNDKKSKNDRGKIKGNGENKWAKAREMVFAGDSSAPPNNNNVTIRNNSNDIDNNDKNKDDRGEIKGNDEDKWAKAREMVFAGGDRKSNNSLPSAEIPNLRGVSSIVQKWRCFEAESKCLQSNSSTRSNSSTTFTENVTCIDIPSRVSDVCDERTVNHDDHFGDWEPDRMAVSGPPSAMGRDSDATAENERLRLRVQDIIRKLTSAKKENNRISNSNSNSSNNNNKKNSDNSNNSNDLGRTPIDHSEQGCFSSVSNSPRIRGRGAFNNLLMQMEAERQKELDGLVERKAVSKFSHRGRIQALLKVRFLRRGLEAKEAPPVNSTPFEFKKFTQSAMTRIRERFKAGIQNSSVEGKNSHREVIDNAASEQSMLNEPVTSSEHQETNGTVISHNVITHDILDEEAFSMSKQHEIDEKIQPHGFTESTEAALSLTDANEIKREKEEDVTSNQQLSGTNDDSVEDCAHQDTHCENNLLMGMDSHWATDVCHPEDGWEELHSDYQEQPETNLDWINDISRPRSDWEDLRQARYCEMLDSFMENKDIQVLLERRSVSTFLSSDLKDRIDRLMLSRTQQQQMNVMKNPIEERREETVIVEERDNGEDEHEVDHDEERSYTDYYDEYEEESDHHYNENDDCIDQSGSSAPPLWINNQSHEVSDDSYQAASPYVQPSLSSNSYSQDHQHISHHTMEMDLIYDLRGQMEQLHQEMSQLRRSIKSCISIQTKLQHSVGQEAAAAVRYSDQKETRHSANMGLSKGKCRICCEMPADSLLYRCGHVCTCFKCAHELQWSSGKCPICGSKIQDVVRINAIS